MLPDRLDSFLTMAASLGVPAGEIGRTGGSSLVVTDRFEIPLDELGAAWRGTLPAAFGGLTRPASRPPAPTRPPADRLPTTRVNRRRLLGLLRERGPSPRWRPAARIAA